MENSTKLEQYQAAALTIYNGLTNQGGLFINSTNYWQAGNVFDTITDFMLIALKQNLLTPSDVNSVMTTVSNNYNINSYSYNGDPGDWYDDFGWWGIASAKAYSSEYNIVFGSFSNTFKSIATSCWSIMTDGKPLIDGGAPNVWANCDQVYFKEVNPYFDGGVWQYDINKTNFNPLLPNVKLGPYQLTVVNGLYFVLSLKLASANVPVGNAISNMHQFITNWCFDVGIKDNKSLLYRKSPFYGLVLERVPIYKNGDQVNPASWAEQNTSWCGDQGLIMGGMAQYLSSFPNDNLATNLVDLISEGVAMQMSSNGIIQPWYPIANNPLYQYDPGDYSSGAGVFMRYLLYTYKNNMSINKQINTENSDLRNLIFNSADACLNGSFPIYDNQLFNQFNMLSTLTAAITVLVDENKTNP